LRVFNEEKFAADMEAILISSYEWYPIVLFNIELARTVESAYEVEVIQRPNKPEGEGLSFEGLNFGLKIGAAIGVIVLVVLGVIFVPKLIKGGRV